MTNEQLLAQAMRNELAACYRYFRNTARAEGWIVRGLRCYQRYTLDPLEWHWIEGSGS